MEGMTMATERKTDHNEEGSTRVCGNKTIFTLHPNDPIPDALIDAIAHSTAMRPVLDRVTLTPAATPTVVRFLAALARSPDAQPASSPVDTESDTVDGTTDASHVAAR